MRKTTKRRSGKVVVLAACCLLAACEKQSSPEDLIVSAQQYLDRGDYAAATIELKNAVAADVNNAKVRWLLGKTYFESGDMESAEKELGRARELGAPAADVMPLLAQVLGAIGKHEELMALTEEGLPKDAQAVVLAAQSLAAFARDDADEARKRIEQALALDPQSVYVRVANVRLLMGNGQVDAARKQLDDVLAGTPDYAPAWSLLGDIEQRQQHPEQAAQAYRRVLELDRNSFGDRLKRALVSIQSGNTEQAVQDIEVLRKASGQHPGVFFAQGLLHLQDNELDKAKEAFEQTARFPASYPFALFYLAAINAQQGNQAQAESYVSQFLEQAPGNLLGRSLAASLAVHGGDYARAEKLVRPVVAANEEDAVALNTLAAALFAQGKTDEGLDVLAKVAALEPESAMAQTRLAAALLATGQTTVGAGHLRKALELDPKFQQADVLLVLNHLQQRDVEGAKRAAEDFRARNPEAPTPYNLQGRVYLVAGEPDKARPAFARALKLAPGDPGASQGLAAIAISEKDYDAARRYYEGALEKHPDHVSVHMQLAALDLAQGDAAAMVERLRQLGKDHPEIIEPRVVLARYYVGRGESGAALGVLDELSGSQKGLPAVLAVTATAQLAQKNFASALSSLDRLVQLQPNVAQHHYQRAMAVAGLGDNAAAQEELETAIELDPKQVPARVALAWLFLSQEDMQKFEMQLVALREIAPRSPDVFLLEAALARSRGDDAAVLSTLERAYSEAPGRVTVQALARERLRREDSKGALELLEGWLGAYASDDSTRMLLAELYGSAGQPERAVKLYRAVLETYPRNLVALNNLAWHLRKSDPKQAVGYAQRAAEVSPESVDVQDTLALAYLENKDLEKAQSAIEQALKLSKDSPTVRYHAALIRRARGDTGGAVLILESLVGSAIEFPEKKEAAGLLASLERK